VRVLSILKKLKENFSFKSSDDITSAEAVAAIASQRDIAASDAFKELGTMDFNGLLDVLDQSGAIDLAAIPKKGKNGLVNVKGEWAERTVQFLEEAFKSSEWENDPDLMAEVWNRDVPVQLKKLSLEITQPEEKNAAGVVKSYEMKHDVTAASIFRNSHGQAKVAFEMNALNVEKAEPADTNVTNISSARKDTTLAVAAPNQNLA